MREKISIRRPLLQTQMKAEIAGAKEKDPSGSP